MTARASELRAGGRVRRVALIAARVGPRCFLEQILRSIAMAAAAVAAVGLEHVLFMTGRAPGAVALHQLALRVRVTLRAREHGSAASVVRDVAGLALFVRTAFGRELDLSAMTVRAARARRVLIVAALARQARMQVRSIFVASPASRGLRFVARAFEECMSIDFFWPGPASEEEQLSCDGACGSFHGANLLSLRINIATTALIRPMNTK